MTDYISRQAAIDGMFAEMPGLTFDGVLRVLRNLPYADVVPVKHGKWIEDDHPTVIGHCSVCGWESHYYEDDVVGMDYCPNCGARMEKS